VPASPRFLPRALWDQGPIDLPKADKYDPALNSDPVFIEDSEEAQ